MFLILYGACEKQIVEKLVNYFSYRGTACYAYNFLYPLLDVAESAALATATHLGKESGFDQARAEEQIERLLYGWFEPSLIPIAKKRMEEVTGRWDSLNMHYIAIISNAVPTSIPKEEFSPGYRVLIKGEKESHPLSDVIFDYAECGAYDYVIDPIDKSAEEVANLIGESLHHKMMSSFTLSPFT